MKKISLVLMGVLALSSAAFAENKPEVTGQIEFKGIVSQGSCTLAPIAPVDLGQVAVSALAAGKDGAEGRTTIKFMDCNLGATDADKSSGIILSINPGNADAQSPELWQNNSNAKGVGVAVKIDGTAITPADTTALTEKKIAGGVVEYIVTGQMVHTSETAVAGDVYTTISFVAQYK